MRPADVPSDLHRFPRPSVAVDVAVVTSLPSGHLGVLLHRRTGDHAGNWALPGRFLRERERLSAAVATALAEKCGLSGRILAGRVPRQLHVFDDPRRDERGWVLSVAHLLSLPYAELPAAIEGREDLVIAPVHGARLAVPGSQRRLPYGQDEIITRALSEVRRAYALAPDPERLLGVDEFTMSELHSVHVTVLGKPWQIDTFRRRMLPQLEETGDVTSGGPGRPAVLYRR